METLRLFKHRCVRDLAWVITSPPLVSGVLNQCYWWQHQDCLVEYQACLPQLIALDNDPSPLLQYLKQVHSNRLGHRFEALVAYWFLLSPNYTLLEKNIQLIQDNVTLGEIDFIIQENASQKVIHLEVTVKFYLGCPPYTDPYAWFGTNIKDQLGKKVDHLTQHQTQLSHKYHQLLIQKGFSIDERHCLMKGRLFYPDNETTPPIGITANHLRGRWKKRQLSESYYYPLEKSAWLGELLDDEIDSNFIQKQPSSPERATCYSELTRNNERAYSEKERWFLLPNKFRLAEEPTKNNEIISP